MFQSFDAATTPETGPARLAALRVDMQRAGLDAFLVPRADRHQGEYVAPCDERLAWLTGFTGSAGLAAVVAQTAGIFVDSRYTVQARAQCDPVFTPVEWPQTQLSDWLRDALPKGGTLGIDPWLNTIGQRDKMLRELDGSGIKITACADLIGQIWEDRPAPPSGPAFEHPVNLAGTGSAEKRENCARDLRGETHRAAILTLPDSICWLLNIRGSDIARIPIVQAFAILHDSGDVALYTTPEKVADLTLSGVTVRDWDAFLPDLAELSGPVRLDPMSAPVAIETALIEAGIDIAHGQDPCLLPKACKTPVELAGSRAAHLRDGAAMCEFLAWLDAQPAGSLTEIDVVTQLEACRRATNALQDISFDTIAGAGPNGAIVHYRVTRGTNRTVEDGDLLLVDSGGQYQDGTTDITRTIAIGMPPPEACRAFTRVLQGMIAISRIRWPEGLAGRDLDPLARMHLWMAGQDYGHGTGHGVGSFLSVHEGPQRLSRTSHEKLLPGMILSNEPGFYREGAFGIRIENLIAVTPAAPLPEGNVADMLEFETLTWVPIDRRLIRIDMLGAAEKAWLNAYHAKCAEKLETRLSDPARSWLIAATLPI